MTEHPSTLDAYLITLTGKQPPRLAHHRQLMAALDNLSELHIEKPHLFFLPPTPSFPWQDKNYFFTGLRPQHSPLEDKIVQEMKQYFSREGYRMKCIRLICFPGNSAYID